MEYLAMNDSLGSDKRVTSEGIDIDKCDLFRFIEWVLNHPQRSRSWFSSVRLPL